MRHYALALIATLVAAIAAATAASTSAAPAATELLVARSGVLYTVKSDGTGLRRLVPGTSGAVSPDGRRLVYAHRDVVYVADASGRNAKRLGRGFGPTWSPDGAWIAYTWRKGVRFYVHLIRPNGTGHRVLTEGAAPAFSPDGSRIAFSSDFKSRENPEIFTIRPNGKGLQRLTRTHGDAEVLGDDGFPSWSPDGKQIVFTSNRTGDGALWIMNANGTRQRQLFGFRGTDEWTPRFSPDGRSIAFARHYADGGRDVYIVRRDGKGARRLVANADEPVWRG